MLYVHYSTELLLLFVMDTIITLILHMQKLKHSYLLNPFPFLSRHTLGLLFPVFYVFAHRILDVVHSQVWPTQTSGVILHSLSSLLAGCQCLEQSSSILGPEQGCGAKLPHHTQLNQHLDFTRWISKLLLCQATEILCVRESKSIT